MAKPVLPSCPTCERTALAWYECQGCKRFSCMTCWRQAGRRCPSCEHTKKKVVDQQFSLGESRFVTWLTIDKHGEYRPYALLGRLVALMGLVDKPNYKATAALLVGTLSFIAIATHRDWLKLLAAGVGMVLPGIYLACHLLKSPVARWQARVMNYKGAMIAKLQKEGHFTVDMTPDAEPDQKSP